MSNEELLTGKTGIPFLPQSRCWPGGTPGQLLWTTEPVYFIQTPKQVWMHWQRDQWVRRIAMTVQHSEHREEVPVRRVDRPLRQRRAGRRYHRHRRDENSVLDMFRTPHTDKLHVVERYKITPDDKFLEALIKVEDEDTFNEPMYMVKRWRRDTNKWLEFDLRREQWRLLQRQPGSDPACRTAGLLMASAPIGVQPKS